MGQAGVYLAYLILALGYMMVAITTLSLSAIATNGKVKGAGGVVLLCRVEYKRILVRNEKRGTKWKWKKNVSSVSYL